MVETVDLIAFDESVLAYQPKKETKNKAEIDGEPISVVFIPRKPHPNGLLLYQAATFIKHPLQDSVLPYIIQTLPHLQVGDTNPIENLKELKRRFKFQYLSYI